MYENATNEDLEIIKLSSTCGYSQEEFDKVKEIHKEQLKREKTSIPTIEESSGKYRYKVLGLKDPTAIFVGHLTDCCQEIGDAGESCMIHSVTSPNGRVCVVRDKNNKVVSQSWIWRNKNILCFDNIEAIEKDSNNRKVVSDDILKAVKRAAKQFVEEDKKAFEEWEKQQKENLDL